MKTIKFFFLFAFLIMSLSSCVVRARVGATWVPAHYNYGPYGGRHWVAGHWAY